MQEALTVICPLRCRLFMSGCVQKQTRQRARHLPHIANTALTAVVMTRKLGGQRRDTLEVTTPGSNAIMHLRRRNLKTNTMQPWHVCDGDTYCDPMLLRPLCHDRPREKVLPMYGGLPKYMDLPKYKDLMKYILQDCQMYEEGGDDTNPYTEDDELYVGERPS